jgi:hypothetical protein
MQTEKNPVETPVQTTMDTDFETVSLEAEKGK